eukprot:jgi/Mesen1/7115/ME000369S06460
MQKLEEQSVRQIRLEDIMAATDDFGNEKLLGKGGYGSVYLGVRDGTPAWAVKRATRANMETLAVFEDEINHRNLVQLLGFCTEGDEQILVYEYVPCGTLQDRLQLSPGSAVAPLSWAQRLDVAVGVARGLNYLHSFSQKPIVHRDIKSANILLDGYAQPKIADFGLSKVLATCLTSSGGGGPGSAAASAVASSIAGTFGYMDPDIQHHLQVTTKLDVFSFGVVLLELLTGKPALMKDPTSGDPTSLYAWALPHINNDNLELMVDPHLFSRTPLEALKLFASVARLCLLQPASDRPSMAHVTLTLEGQRGHTYVEPVRVSSQDRHIGYQLDPVFRSESSSSYSGRAPLSRPLGSR